MNRLPFEIEKMIYSYTHDIRLVLDDIELFKLLFSEDNPPEVMTPLNFGDALNMVNTKNIYYSNILYY